MRAGRRPEEIRLVSVTKTVGVDEIKQALDVGLRIFGESKVQEAKHKISDLKLQISNLTAEWHLIGHLQRNKVRHAVQLFDMIQSVDSEGLAEDIDREAARIGKIQRVLIQVKLSEEDTKSGATEAAMPRLAETVSGLENLKLEGLMTIPPFFDDPKAARPYFRRLRELRDELTKEGFDLPELSMGMSGDFEVAIEEGATLVRVGTAIFGERRTT